MVYRLFGIFGHFFIFRANAPPQVMQRALEHFLPEQRDKLIDELDGHIIEFVKSANANHVIQRLITLDPPTVVVDAFTGHVHELSVHPFGCRVLQKTFDVLHPNKIRVLIDEMYESSYMLMRDQFGNYVVQSIITKEVLDTRDRDRVVMDIKGRIYEREWQLCGRRDGTVLTPFHSQPTQVCLQRRRKGAQAHHPGSPP